MADDMAAFIEALGLRKPLICGYSDGGQIALEIGMRHPDLARALVVSGAFFQSSETVLDAASALLALEHPDDEVDPEKLEREQPIIFALLRDGHQYVYGPEYWETYVRQLKRLWFTPLHYSAEDLARVPAPTLVLMGDRDDFSPLMETVGMYQHLPKGELAVIAGSGHDFLFSKVDLFATLVLEFLLRHRDHTDG